MKLPFFKIAIVFWLTFCIVLGVAAKVYGATELRTKTDVAKAFAKHRPMVIMFYTDWCPSCKVTKPEYFKTEKKFPNVDFYLMNVDKIALRMDVESHYIPSFVAGTNEKDIRSGRSLMDGISHAKMTLTEYVRKYTGEK